MRAPREDPRGRPPGRGSPPGFTLVELMVALAIGSLLLATVFAGLHQFQRSWNTSRIQVSGVRNQRAGVELMIRDIRMAGSGFGGRAITTSGITDPAIHPLQPRPGIDGDPDTLIVTAAFDGVATVNSASMGSPSDPLMVADVSGFAVGDLVVITNGPAANLFQVTSIINGEQLGHAISSPYNQPSGHAVWPAGGYPPGSMVTRVRRVRYWVDGEASPPRLVRRLDHGTELPVSSGAAGLVLSYGMADGTISPSPADPSLIRSVILRYVPEDFHGHAGDAPGDTLTVRVQPRVLG